MDNKYHDLVFYNADIVTMDPVKESAEILGIKDDQFSYIGDYQSKIIDTAILAIDIEGKTIVPGFIDLHTHLWSEAHVISVDLGSFQTYEEVIKKLETEVKLRKPGEWILASKWDESKWQDRKEFLKKEDLDAISPNNPLYARREDGHLIVANSLAFEQLNIPDSHPGVEKDSSGKPTGVLKDVWLDLSPYYKHLIPESIEKSANIAVSKGITSVVDNLTIGSESQQYIMQSYFNLDLEDKLPLRVFLNPTRDLMNEFSKLGVIQNWGSSKVRFSGFKGFFDGAVGAHTALISSPYLDVEGNGVQFMNEDVLVSQIAFAEKNDYTMCIHAIGDLAIEKLLNCYEKGIKETGKDSSKRQHRIEHAEMVTDDHIEKAKKLGILLSMQPNFLKWEYPSELYEHRLGKDRFMTLNRFATILQKGSKVYFGSDNMPLSPFFGIQQASSFPSTEVKISVMEAMKAYTINNAQALFMESKLGSISTGKYADFVILTKSPLKIESLKITNDLVEKTYVGGKEVYSAKN